MVPGMARWAAAAASPAHQVRDGGAVRLAGGGRVPRRPAAAGHGGPPLPPVWGAGRGVLGRASKAGIRLSYIVVLDV